jgi:hypothetical protein
MNLARRFAMSHPTALPNGIGPGPPEQVADAAISLDEAAGLMARFGFVAFRTPPGDPMPDACLMAAIRSQPTGRHFDPEMVSYWVHDHLGAHLERMDEHSDVGGFTRFSWGPIRLMDRFGVRNSFVSFGGTLHAERIDPDALLSIFRSRAPILRLAGHSQRRDRAADEVLSFFARLIPRLWSAPAERMVAACTPEVLYAAFLRHTVLRMATSVHLREAISDEALAIDSELAIMAAHRPADVAAGQRFLDALGLTR